ncbi:ribonuclease 1-like [Amaranthus tricolor]|uniref:ribonuclease 1-like n=1 Tax=Amaranthus tricolor TaxID=29722 RepID=UPI00258F9B9A|nr:ribonuclease 1-like [Amaranthus tricolor]
MAKGKILSLIRLKLVVLLSLSTLALGYRTGGFRAFYFVQQWLGSYCNQRGTRCCYPPTGKPKPDFTIYGLWPYYNDGSFPYNCGDDNYDVGRIKYMEGRLQKSWPTFTCPQIGRKFWVHEWNKHGTCTKSILGELNYFEGALYLKSKVNIYQALAKAGIRPDNNRLYPLKSIKKAIARATGFHPWIVCNTNARGHKQIWQVTLCSDKTGKKLIKCPYLPKGRGNCDNKIQLPSYY